MLTLLDPNLPEQPFPSVQEALDDPEGLLAVGGCLSQTRLLNAYRHGIFPWYSPEEPILWWSPNPRLVMFPAQFKASRSLRKKLNKGLFNTTYDRAFNAVIDACSQPRQDQNGTWISTAMKSAYFTLFRTGYAHSIEAWREGRLVGGLYGVSLGQVFFGESMFHIETDASKVAFAFLIKQLLSWNYQLIDCQVHTEHLASLGAVEISRDRFDAHLDRYCESQPAASAWSRPA